MVRQSDAGVVGAWAQATKHAKAMARMDEEAGRSLAARLRVFGLLRPAQRPAQSWCITMALAR
eukprot:scaffold132_cov61-Phaeocystis_antarctica.AAC.2